MDKLDALYRDADDSGVPVVFCPIERDSMITCNALGALILLNSSRHHSRAQELYMMAQEMGHWHTDSYYTIASTVRSRIKAEFQADTWMVLHMVTPVDLRAAFAEGCTELWQLAERFDLPEQIIERAIEIYRAKGLL